MKLVDTTKAIVTHQNLDDEEILETIKYLTDIIEKPESLEAAYFYIKNAYEYETSPI